MQLDRLIGSESVCQAIQKALAEGTLSHAVLLTAPDGAGRGFAARCLAADYLYPEGGRHVASVMREECPEMLVLQGEGKSGQIPVERVRAVRHDIFQSALSTAGRVVLIKDAHRMNASSFNALLKILEEPPGQVLFILTARDASSLAPTLRSRCSLYPLGLPTYDQCRQELEKSLPGGTPPELPALLARVYSGRIGSGLQVLESGERLAVFRDALAAAKAAGEQNTYELLRIFAGYEGKSEEDRENRKAFISDMVNALAAVLRSGEESGLPEISSAQVVRLLPWVTGAQRALIATNAAPKIVFTSLAVHLSANNNI